MECEVIVVGGGIGGLTTAALLAARGMDVCLFERQSEVGGCVANFEHLGYRFEPTFGCYAGWEADGIWDRIFSSLPAPQPEVTKLSPNYVVRIPGGRYVKVSSDPAALEDEIATAFPDCAGAAIDFLRHATGNHDGDAARLLQNTSRHFRAFVESQLQMFAQCCTDECSWQRTAHALQVATGDLWSINGGAQVLAERMAQSLKASGGALRLDSPVLRLSYGTDSRPRGVDLLSGERVIATRAVVSNLTIWDTYGKLIGPGRTPRETAMALKKLSSWGAYLMFLGIDEAMTHELPAPRTLLVYDSAGDGYDPEHQQLMLNLADTSSGPEGKTALTAIAFTNAEDWFSFHEDHSWHEEKDQALLETWWTRLHDAMPALGPSVEVIETNTPQTLYETCRRRFGMIGAPRSAEKLTDLAQPFPNLFMVGDTISDGMGLHDVAKSAIAVAEAISRLKT